MDAIHRKPAKKIAGQSLAIVVEDHCIGCGLCAHNCPFGSIHMDKNPKHQFGGSERVATNCDLCESVGGIPRCVQHCPHDAAVRMPGIELARQVGLTPLGSAKDTVQEGA